MRGYLPCVSPEANVAPFERCVDYIHYNPFKHKLVKRAAEWPYPTFHRFVSHGVYADNWGTDSGTISANAGECVRVRDAHPTPAKSNVITLREF